VQEDAEPLEIKKPFRWDGRARVRHLSRADARQPFRPPSSRSGRHIRWSTMIVLVFMFKT